MFGSIGMPELILIFIVALLVFGPKKLPELGKSLGRGLAEFKRASEDLKKTIEDEIEQGKQEADAVKKQVADVRSTFTTVLEIVSSVLQANGPELDEEMVDTFSRIFFGAMSSAGEWVSTSQDPNAAAARVEAAIGFILNGMRAQLEAGVEVTS